VRECVWDLGFDAELLRALIECEAGDRVLGDFGSRYGDWVGLAWIFRRISVIEWESQIHVKKVRLESILFSGFPK
jgi:hypothetical protein